MSKKITDKMRLDWLIHEGNLWSDDCVGDSLWSAEGHGPACQIFNARRPRHAIDKAIRAERKKRCRA